MKVLYHNRHVNPEAEASYGARYTELAELMEQSDFVVVVTPLTEETRGMIGQNEIARMKKTAVFVNVARGPVVDEKALYEALKEKRIYAAGWTSLPRSQRIRKIRCCGCPMWYMSLI